MNPWLERLEHALGTAGVQRALTTCILGVAVFQPTLVRLIGWAGLGGAVAILLVFALGALWSQRLEIDWRGLLPISLLSFVAWTTLTLAWSSYPSATVQGIALQLGLGVLGLTVALSRETSQILRSLATILRVAVFGSLALEIFAGVLIDMPIRFLNIHGNLERLGPLQGLFGDRNAFGLVCVIAIATFAVEWAMRSVPHLVSVFSLVAAVAGLFLSRSPVAIGTAIVVGLGAAALVGIRRARRDQRSSMSLAVGLSAFIGVGLAWTFRSGIIEALRATGEVSYRQQLWDRIFMLIPFNQIEGWGWVGLWHPEISPFNISPIQNRSHASASSAYIDVLFQLGAVGLCLFIVLLGLTFTRLWIVATRRTSVVVIWPVVVMGVIVIMSFARSDALWGFFWVLLVICAVTASRQMSWRSAFAAGPTPTEPITRPV